MLRTPTILWDSPPAVWGAFHRKYQRKTLRESSRGRGIGNILNYKGTHFFLIRSALKGNKQQSIARWDVNLTWWRAAPNSSSSAYPWEKRNTQLQDILPILFHLRWGGGEGRNSCEVHSSEAWAHWRAET